MYNYSINDKVNVTTNSVSCQGNIAPNDHPLVYLKVSKSLNKVICPYCSKEFRLKII